ncbi:hypothetical protein ACLB2K_073651 [Fragaria x ananassa]
MDGGWSEQQGTVTCGSWIRRPENVNWVVFGTKQSTCSVLTVFSYDPNTTSLSSSPLATYVFEAVDGEPVSIAVHPSGDDIVCSTSNGGCK